MSGFSEDDLKKILAENDQISVADEAPAAAIDNSGRGSSRSNDQSRLVKRLIAKLKQAGIPEPAQELRFYPARKWRFDLHWQNHDPSIMVIVEVEGGIWMQTNAGFSKGHAHPKRFLDDCEKYNEAAIIGYTVIRVTAEHINSGQAVEWIVRALQDTSLGHK